MGQFLNYLMEGFYIFKNVFLIGGAMYLIILLAMYVLKIRRNITWKCIPELLLSIYSIALLKITGIFSLTFSLNGFHNCNLIPFVGSSPVLVLLNLILFLPLGFLLPVVFRSCKKNVKKIVLIGALLSFGIELLQMFGGRYAEIDDFIVNTAGTFSGYILYSCIVGWKENRKKALISGCSLCAVLAICFTGIYLIGDNEPELPMGLEAVEDNIAEVNVYSAGEKQMVDENIDAYGILSMQLLNYGGHILEVKSVSQDEIWNDHDSFIEIIYTTSQTIPFEDTGDFELANADRLLYNATQNILYWGNGSYQNSMDYAKFDDKLQQHSHEILEQYKELQTSIDECFK